MAVKTNPTTTPMIPEYAMNPPEKSDWVTRLTPAIMLNIEYGIDRMSNITPITNNGIPSFTLTSD